MERKCSKCELIKTTDDFTLDNQAKDKLKKWCKACSSEHRLKYYSENKEQINRQSREFNLKNAEFVAARKLRYRENNVEKRMVYTAQRRAAKKGWDFNLEVSDIIIPEYCPVLGLKLELYNKSMRRTSPSLDRIDSSKGYTKDNIQVISWLANTMKTNATFSELHAFAEWVLNTIPKELND